MAGARQTIAPREFDRLVGPIARGMFITKHLGGEVRFSPQRAADAPKKIFTPLEEATMKNIVEQGELPKLRSYMRTELGVKMTQSKDGMFIVHYEVVGYLPYLCGLRGFIDTSTSLLSVSAVLTTADKEPKIIFQHRSDKVAVAKGLIGASAEGNMEIGHQDIAGMLSAEVAVANEIIEEVGMVGGSTEFMGAARDVALSNNHALTYVVRSPYTEQQIKLLGNASWEVGKTDYVGNSDLDAYIGKNREMLVPTALFSALLFGFGEMGEQWLKGVGKYAKTSIHI